MQAEGIRTSSMYHTLYFYFVQFDLVQRSVRTDKFLMLGNFCATIET